MIILLLSNMLYDEWKQILLLWEQSKILDGYAKLHARLQLVEKSAFNCFVGLKEICMVKLVHGLKVHEILLHNQLVTQGNLHLLTMTKFCYNMKKRRVVRNEIMVFHKQPQPRTQNPHPYTEEMWKNQITT